MRAERRRAAGGLERGSIGAKRERMLERAEQDDDPVVKGSAEGGGWEYATEMCGCPTGVSVVPMLMSYT